MSARGRRSLRTHLLASIGAIVVLSAVLTIAVGAVLTRREVERATLSDVSHQADLLAAQARGDVAGVLHAPRLKPFLALQSERLETPPLDRPSPYLSDEALQSLRSRGEAHGTVRIDGESYVFAARPVAPRAFVLLRPERLSATASRPYIEGLLLAGLVGVALAVAAAFLLARAIARPVHRVAEASRSLAAARSPEPVPVEGASELASLAVSFNNMAVQLERARAAERSFLLSVSHELKTPLTAIRGYGEGLAEGAVPAGEAAETIALEARRLERLVQDLLDLARMNKSEFSVHSEPIDLAAAARDTVRRYEAQARDFQVSLEVEAPDPAPALGDADRILQVVSNLVENALRLTPRGGTVRVVAAACTLTVEDTGPGLEPEELPRAFERFFLHSRYGRERPVGTGLGLAIVKELVEGMHGSVEAASEPGRSTRFVVRLPAVPPAEIEAAGKLLARA